MKTAENRRGDDAVAVANPMARRHRREVGRIRNTGPEARVWTPTIVVRDPVPENSANVTLVKGIIQSRHSRRIVPITRSQNAFACGDRTGVLRIVSPIAAIVRSTPSE
jgi:hypothetical protein